MMRSSVDRVAGNAGIAATGGTVQVEPTARQVDAAHAVGAQVVEFHTGRYCHLSGDDRAVEFERLQAAATRFANAADVATRRTYLAALTDAAFETGQAAVVGAPATSMLSLTAKRSPASGPLRAPAKGCAGR